MQSEDAPPTVIESPTPRNVFGQAAPLSFGSSRKGNAVAQSAPTKPLSSTKKISPAANRSVSTSSSSLQKRSALAAFGVDAENDSRLAANIRLKKLDRDLLGLEVQKAKIDLLAQRELAQNARQAEVNQIKVLELQLQMQVQQRPPPRQPHVPNIAAPVHQQMLPINTDMVFGNDNLSMQEFLDAPLDDYDVNLTGGLYAHNT